jgi:hypothetical protein
MRGLSGDLGLGDLEAAVKILGWSDERAEWEVANYKSEIEKFTGFA